MTNNWPSGHRGNKQWEDWDRFFSILQKEDPHQRLRGIHNGSKWYDHTKDWVTHASLQSSDMKGGVRFHARYRKPVIYDECRYEGDLPDTWGNLTAREMVQRFCLGTLSGCYVGHGETYKHPQDILWWSKAGVLHGQSPQRIQWLKDFMSQVPTFHELQPLGDDKGRFLLAKPGEYYLLYCPDRRNQTLTLAGDRPYKIDVVDPWKMTVTPVGTAPAGEFAVSPPKPDLAFRFTPYRPGEKLRPEARITASVTEGPPSLEVRLGRRYPRGERRAHGQPRSPRRTADDVPTDFRVPAGRRGATSVDLPCSAPRRGVIHRLRRGTRCAGGEMGVASNVIADERHGNPRYEGHLQ
jgi:hypothetical protein